MRTVRILKGRGSGGNRQRGARAGSVFRGVGGQTFSLQVFVCFCIAFRARFWRPNPPETLPKWSPRQKKNDVFRGCFEEALFDTIFCNFLLIFEGPKCEKSCSRRGAEPIFAVFAFPTCKRKSIEKWTRRVSILKPKSEKNLVKMVSRIRVRLEVDFLVIFWGLEWILGGPWGAKLEPKIVKKLVSKGYRLKMGSGIDFGWIFEGFWEGLGRVLEGLCRGIWVIFED